MSTSIPSTLISELLKLKAIKESDVSNLKGDADKNNKDFGQVLVDNSILSDKDLLQIKSKLYHFPVLDLEKTDLDKIALGEISEDVVSFYKIAPFAKEGNILKVGIINPEDIDALEALKFIATDKGLTLEKYLIGYRDFETVLRSYKTLGGEIGKALEALNEELDKKEILTPKLVEDIGTEGAVTKIVASILKYAVESRASDIHIEPFEEYVRVRFRVDGSLATSLTLPKNVHSAVVTRIKILSSLKIDEMRLAQDGRFSTSFSKKRYDFRVSTFPTKTGEKVVMRILDPLTEKIELAQLGVDGRSLEVLERAISKPFGSILITGPTGSGKSTTLAGLLRKLNKEDVNIVTLEDPIEYYLEGVNQSQIHEEIGYTFANGLRYILRQDPDIIMVGEIRDKETAGLATQAALTGHIVLSTLHTNDAIGVIPRLIDMSVEKYLIPSTLNVAAAQRLLRRLCPECKVQDKANPGEKKIIDNAIGDMPEEYHELLAKEYVIYKPNLKNPCKTCGGKAFKGRIGIFEMLEMTDQLEEIILGSLSESAMKEEGKRQGMINIFEDGILKVLKGMISLEELLEVAQTNEST